MQTKEAVIRNRAGIHCRPSSAIMVAAAKFPGHDITVTKNGTQVKLGSILDLLSMGLKQGDAITLKVSGPNEAEACEKLAELFETEFDFV